MAGKFAGHVLSVWIAGNVHAAIIQSSHERFAWHRASCLRRVSTAALTLVLLAILPKISKLGCFPEAFVLVTLSGLL